MRFTLVVGVIMSLSFFSCGQKISLEKASPDYVKGELEKLAPVTLKVDLSSISESDQKALKKLIEAGKLIDELFLLQVYPENPQIKNKLQQSGSENQAYLDLFTIMFGPWNRLEHETPFLVSKEKPHGAGFYPEDMTKEEFENVVEKNPDLKKDFENTFTVISRKDGKLTAIPYHVAYNNLVKKVSQLLNEGCGSYRRFNFKDLFTITGKSIPDR